MDMFRATVVLAMLVASLFADPPQAPELPQAPERYVSTPIQKTAKKACPCSTQCVCGCNESGVCDCNEKKRKITVKGVMDEADDDTVDCVSCPGGVCSVPTARSSSRRALYTYSYAPQQYSYPSYSYAAPTYRYQTYSAPTYYAAPLRSRLFGGRIFGGGGCVSGG